MRGCSKPAAEVLPTSAEGAQLSIPAALHLSTAFQIAVLVIVSISLGIGIGVGLSLNSQRLQPFVGVLARNVLVSSGGRRLQVAANATGSLPAAAVTIEAGTSLVAGLNLQKALDTVLAADLTDVFTPGSVWRVKNVAAKKPRAPDDFFFGHDDTVTFGSGLQYTGRKLSIGAFGLCSPSDVDIVNDMDFTSSLTLAGSRLFLATASIVCKTENGCLTDAFAWSPGHVPIPVTFCQPNSPCRASMAVYVASATADEVVFIGSSGTLMGSRCGVVSVFHRLPS